LLGLTEEEWSDVVDLLEDFQVTEGADLGALADSDIVSLITIIPKAKRHKLMKLLAEFRPVLISLSFFLSISLFALSILFRFSVTPFVYLL